MECRQNMSVIKTDHGDGVWTESGGQGIHGVESFKVDYLTYGSQHPADCRNKDRCSCRASELKSATRTWLQVYFVKSASAYTLGGAEYHASGFLALYGKLRK